MNLKTALVSLVAMVAASAPAVAAWPPNTNQTVSGALDLSQASVVPCDVTIDLSIDSSDDPTITGVSFLPGSFFCGSIVVPTGSWEADWGPGANDITLSIGWRSMIGSCAGVVVADFNHTTNTITFNNVVVPGTPNDCTVDGSLS